MNSYPPPADPLRLSSAALQQVIGLVLVVSLVVAGIAYFAPPAQFVCQWALDFNATRTVPSYVGRPLAEAMAERSYCVRPGHNELTCEESQATVVSQNVSGPQNPLHTTSRLAFEARC